jgi:hypothetical protein
MPEAAQVTVPQIVTKNDDDIGRLRFGGKGKVRQAENSDQRQQ